MDEKKRASIIELQSYIREQVKAVRATVLAEEFSVDALQLSNASVSTVEEMARELGLRHLFCDPRRAIRRQLNITTPVEREAYWLEQLRPFQREDIIFFCGEIHISTFGKMLSSAGWSCRVLSTGWGKALNPLRQGEI